MDVVFGLIPMMLFFGFLVVVVFIWMAKSGQFDDLDGAANSIFMEDDYDEAQDEAKEKTSKQQASQTQQLDDAVHNKANSLDENRNAKT